MKIQNFNENFKKGVLKYFKKFMKFIKLSKVKISSPISISNALGCYLQYTVQTGMFLTDA